MFVHFAFLNFSSQTSHLNLAPQQCDIYRNVGAVMVLESETFEFKLYDYVSHPQWMPRFENAFDISLPLITVKSV